MTGRLKVYDADIPGWKYVDSAGEAVQLLNYVPLSPHLTVVSSSTAANIGVTHTPTITGIPPEAVAVSVIQVAAHSAIATGHRYQVFAYDAALGGLNLRAQMMAGKVANHYETVTAPYVELGGDRQFDYSVTIGAAGTTTYILYVTGYWLKVNSGAISMGGGNVVGKGTAFPLLPAINDQFYRTDLHMQFYWSGTYWLSDTLFSASSSIESNATAYFISSSASKARVMMASIVTTVGSDVWIDSIGIAIQVSSGGTALSASHKWSCDFKLGNATIPATALASIVIDSGASNVMQARSVAVGALRGAEDTNPVVSMDIVKTGTPGDLGNTAPFNVFYRIVAT